MRRTRQRAAGRVRGLALILGVLAVWAVAGAQWPAPEPPVALRYVVESGDTLWALAELTGVRGWDRRELVFALKRVNGLESAVIHPGQQLLIPRGKSALRAALRDPVRFLGCVRPVNATPRPGRPSIVL